MSAAQYRGAAPSGTKPLLPGDVKFIAVHCSATGPAQDVGAADIDRWHRLRGFVKVGYHFVIRRDGAVETGRPLNERGAHVVDFNHNSVGVCLVGGTDGTKAQKPQANFTPAQLQALKALLSTLSARFPSAVVQGHRDFPGVAKACPSFDVRHWLKTESIRP
jgi:N-acetylmuramoyl-L-alanine amidase